MADDGKVKKVPKIRLNKEGDVILKKSPKRLMTERILLGVGFIGLVYAFYTISACFKKWGGQAFTWGGSNGLLLDPVEKIALTALVVSAIAFITGCYLFFTQAKPVGRKLTWARALSYLQRYWMLYVMLVPPLAFFVIFRYLPMVNIAMAFKKYDIFHSLWEVNWVGWKYFQDAFASRDFLQAIRNTVWLNFLDLLVGFPGPIILAILLNELAFPKFKKITQTVLYMPHFLSWIIISGLALQLFLPSTGLINDFLYRNNMPTIAFLETGRGWVATYIGLGVWQSIGWNTIIYLAAIVGINPELYEAASVDGANRLQKIWHITLPGLRPTIVVLLILNLGRMLGSDFDRPWALRNYMVNDVANVISTHVYQVGIRANQFALATAIGLFQSVVCIIFLLSANAISKKLGERGIM